MNNVNKEFISNDLDVSKYNLNVRLVEPYNAAINIKNLLTVLDGLVIATNANDEDLIPHRVNSIF